MIRILDSSTDNISVALKGRSVQRDAETERIVATIIDDVRKRGDAALLDSGRRFDAPEISSLRPIPEEYGQEVDPKVKLHLDSAGTRITNYHLQQFGRLFEGWKTVGGPSQDADILFGWHDEDFSAMWHTTESSPKKTPRQTTSQLGQRAIPLRRVGVYVPGGNAAYPSSVLMNAIPAQVAGVREIVVTTPARRDGTIHPAVLVAASMIGVQSAENPDPIQVFKIGGAAAIAALGLGTESVPRVDKIVGPGNRFVNEAKRQLWGQVGLDGYAGPSEVCVLADDAANEEFAAADLLTQVEHAPDNAGFLVCLSRAKLDAILVAVERQLQGAPREGTMRQALRDNSLAVVARDLSEAIEIVNAIAPEHLTLAVAEPEKAMDGVRNAGCILLGEYTPESAGDYCLGPSHTLPTSGAARWQSPVNVLDFLKVQSVARLSKEDLQPLIPTIETLAQVEGFPAHGFGATVRREA